MTNSFDINKLNQHQRQALNELKDCFKDYADKYLHDENYLMHWIIARKYDSAKAAAMLLWHYRMRKAIGMDDPSYRTFQTEPIMDKYYPHGVFQHDKEGRPIAYFPIGGIDAKGIVSNVKSSDIYRAIMYWQEQRKWNCEYASKRFDKNIQQATYIIDLKGLGAKHLWKPGLDVFQEILHLVEQHTPEIMYRLFIINAPAVFPIIYKLVKPVLDENTKNKIQIFGGKQRTLIFLEKQEMYLLISENVLDDFQEALLQAINVDELPIHYGGMTRDETGDPDCKKHICYGGPVPLDEYKNAEKMNQVSDESSSTEIRIKAGSQALIPVDVSENDTIEWYIGSESSHDFFFAVYRSTHHNSATISSCNGDNKGADKNIIYISNKEDITPVADTKNMEMVVPYYRIFAHLVPETGRYDAKIAGRCKKQTHILYDK